MLKPSPTAAKRAGALLEAWEREDLRAFEAQLSRIRLEFAGRNPINNHEDERMELLDGIARQMRQDLLVAGTGTNVDQNAALCFRMLRHIAGQTHPPAIRSGRLFSSPC
jgi:hypothetical protein